MLPGGYWLGEMTYEFAQDNVCLRKPGILESYQQSAVENADSKVLAMKMIEVSVITCK